MVRSWGVGAALVLLVVAGCSGPSEPAGPSVASSSAPSPSGSGSGSPSVSGSSSVVAPVLPDAAKQPTRPGAEAFFRYFLDVYSYSFTALDPLQLRTLSSADCKFCTNAVSRIEGAKADGSTSEGGQLRAVVVVAAPGDPATGILVNATADQEPGVTRDAKGAVTGTSPGAKDIRMDASLRWSSDQWQVTGVHVFKPGESG